MDLRVHSYSGFWFIGFDCLHPFWQQSLRELILLWLTAISLLVFHINTLTKINKIGMYRKSILSFSYSIRISVLEPIFQAYVMHISEFFTL